MRVLGSSLKALSIFVEFPVNELEMATVARECTGLETICMYVVDADLAAHAIQALLLYSKPLLEVFQLVVGEGNPCVTLRELGARARTLPEFWIVWGFSGFDARSRRCV